MKQQPRGLVEPFPGVAGERVGGLGKYDYMLGLHADLSDVWGMRTERQCFGLDLRNLQKV